ncbi:terminase large subunit [Acinetobacter phage VB_ApiP_XC38]|uniref:Terminase large subunit n=1 Tax=Acinetobacter phage VB_ApiP_XC38 TaxID=2655002 RepID=A0A5P8PQY4_9CAUD|nr:terminase large subunit [Acinetobacter phage VB_ApiP_XC38]QFR59690.1 terminase large subunit [Acinetobacter phage VB_ApiP_XC38]
MLANPELLLEDDDNTFTDDLGLEVKTVEEWLNTVSYAPDPNYVPSKFATMFVNFIKLVNGGQGEENVTPTLHLKMLDQIDQPNSRKIANMVHRGAAKTTVLGEYLILYLATFGELPTFGRVDFALYVSDSIDNGVKNMRKNLEYRWENSDFLKKYVPMAKFTDIHWHFKNKEGKEFIVKGYGAKTGVRGTKANGKRPQLAILDDLVSDEDARSKTMIAAIEDTVHKAIDHAMHPTRSKIIWSGTPFNASDPLYKALESGAWAVNCYPVCERFPCTRAEFRGSWEDRFTYDYVKRKYLEAMKSGTIHTFNQELMLRIMSDEDRLVHDGDINWYKRGDVLKEMHKYNFYITTDYATTEDQSGDFAFTSVWAVNSSGHKFWVDGVCARQSMDKNVDDLFRFAQRYKPMSVGIEVTGQQEGFISWIRAEMGRRKVYFNLASSGNSSRAGIRPNTNKLQRFMTVVPWFKLGEMFFPEECRNDPTMIEMMEELKLASANGLKSKHDDAIDTISMLGLMNILLPGEEAPMQYNESSGVFEAYVSHDEVTTFSTYTV